MLIITQIRCSKCRKIKDETEFTVNTRRKSGKVSQCKECRHAYYVANKSRLLEYSRKYGKDYKKNNRDKILDKQRSFYKNNRDKAIAWIRDWRNRNPDKAVEYRENRRAEKMNSDGKVTAREWKLLKDFYGNKCLCCGTTSRLTQDHVIPLKLGGKHSIDNLQPLCHSCNAKKGVKVVDYRDKIY